MSSKPSKPVPSGSIDFPAAGLAEYAHCYAVVLDSLFPKPALSETLAEAERFSPWDVAQMNLGPEAYTVASYRNGQRIVYDAPALSAQLFATIRPHLAAIEEIEERTVHPDGRVVSQKWRMVRLNERLRFLRYPKGGFFHAHCDGEYTDKKTGQQTFFTVQLYLPSDSSGSPESFVPAGGGSTRFYDNTGAYADVEAIPGRVLVFQHAELEHTGEEVTEGVKCTMRSDILYERVGPPVPVPKEGAPATYHIRSIADD
ncbi:hypothetical protein B0H15DRAFT_774039 [Mycena belliarum]|uniref:Prolyl 4-hydroxylase alpha subunit domain-containing protein n=1 Tax=Mycena belliarum TaxID=1033014 RepID=A0AAD6XSK1_9AGAR|nr:hypothetical protein B0H15DRAFT_774039 [Mycena belliae]